MLPPDGRVVIERASADKTRLPPVCVRADPPAQAGGPAASRQTPAQADDSLAMTAHPLSFRQAKRVRNRGITIRATPSDSRQAGVLANNVRPGSGM